MTLLFFADRHFFSFLVPDMTIEKLQKVATAHVDASVKARWLRWWNSPADVKTINKFPLLLCERVLDDWLYKTSFWAQVLESINFLILFLLFFFVISNLKFVWFHFEKGIEAKIASFENECSIDVDWATAQAVLQPDRYVKHWRLILWDKVFRVYFDEKGDLKFTKGLDLIEFEEGPIAVKRIAYR